MSLVQQLTSDSDQRMALQIAFYNVLFFVLAGICLTGLYAVYKMMYMFLTPLLWATLVGTILFPFKKRFSNAMKDWLSRTVKEDTPLLIAIVLIPYDGIISATDLLIHLARREGIMIFAAYLVLKSLNNGAFVSLIHFFGDVYQYIDSLIQFFARTWISFLMVFYFAAFAGWLYVQDRQTINKGLARIMSLPLWLFGLATISNFCGPFRAVVMIVISTVLGTIAAGVLTNEDINKDESKKIDIDTVDDKLKKATETPSEEKSEITLGQALTGDFYVQAVAGLCALEFTVRHDFVIVIIVFLAAFAVLRKISVAFGVQTGLTDKISTIWKSFYERSKHFIHVTVAGPLRRYFKFLFSSDEMMKNSLRAATDDLSAVLVITLVIVSTLCAGGIVVFQVHSEVAHLIRLSGNLLSQQPDRMMNYARNYKNNQPNETDIDDYIEQGYLKGRVWLATNIRSLIGAKDPVKGELLEKEVVELLDKLYQMWGRHNSDEELSSAAHGAAVKDWMTHLKTLTNISTLKREAFEVIKANVDTIMSVAQSVWSVIVTNVSILSTTVFALFTILINFGLEILNFFIEMIVFLTALYYLLASSREMWLPIKWIGYVVSMSLPSSYSAADCPSSYSAADVMAAIENAISGVFVLSSKMSVFYGLYTYFIHTLFDINFVFIPSMLAAVFAAIPIMAPHVVCIFGFLELYFVERETAAAVLFVLASLAPKTFADAAFYNELRGSHPYVTGLAIIGGIYWLGLQGAIIGPIVLCSMIVLLNVYSKFAIA